VGHAPYAGKKKKKKKVNAGLVQTASAWAKKTASVTGGEGKKPLPTYAFQDKGEREKKKKKIPHPR